MQEDLFVTEAALKSKKSHSKNLFALCIIFGGLFLGSLFIDLVQLISGEGFSPWATRNHNVLETTGKTWVGYGDPKVTLQVITDKDCTACDPSEALVWLRRVVPTIEVTRIDMNDELGKQLAERSGVVTIPAFIFSKDILHTSFYSQASSLFQPRDGRYFFDMSKIGLPAGRYLKLPTVGENAIVSGPQDAKVTIVEFSDFECPYCKTFHKDLKQVAAAYGDQVRLVYKHLPLSFHVQAENAAIAAQCANEQGKFDIYADYLFTKQTEWSKTSGLQKFKDYAWWLKLDFRAFSSCLDSEKYKDKVAKDKEEAANLLISATPATFVGGTFLDGAVTADDIKQAIEAELAK
ncbi:MAG: thioredoxin domain-containing protein [Candidatus Moranbacteria bacterium]|nr:thioredoxin domain-containing protein [Candidatus Moranbacteria bacterium]